MPLAFAQALQKERVKPYLKIIPSSSYVFVTFLIVQTLNMLWPSWKQELRKMKQVHLTIKVLLSSLNAQWLQLIWGLHSTFQTQIPKDFCLLTMNIYFFSPHFAAKKKTVQPDPLVACGLVLAHRTVCITHHLLPGRSYREQLSVLQQCMFSAASRWSNNRTGYRVSILQILKPQLDTALSNLLYFTLLWAEQHSFKGFLSTTTLLREQ